MAKKKNKLEEVKYIVNNLERFAKGKSIEVGKMIEYIAIISFVPALAVAILSWLGLSQYLQQTFLIRLVVLALATWISPLVLLVGIVIFAIISLIISAVVLQIFANILGGKGKLKDTVHATGIGLIPTLLFGWIPIVNVWSSLYGLVLVVWLLSLKHRFPLAKAAAVIALPLIIVSVLILFAVPFSGLTTGLLG